MPKDVSVDDDPEFPFPGDYTPSGFTTQYIRLATLTKPQLSEHCKTFQLAYSGNKPALLDRLKNFSKDKTRWDSLIPGATNTHKGSRKPQEEKKGKPKTSTLRRESLFHGAAGVRIANAPVTERSKDLRTAEEKAAILPWAKHIVEQYPYKPNINRADANASIYISPPAVNAEPASQTQTAPSVPVHNSFNVPVANPPQTAMDLLAGFIAYVQHNQNILSSHPTSDVPLTAAPPLPSSTASESGSATTGNPAATDLDMSVSTSVPSSASNNETPTRTLALAGGRFITFRESDIPDPPAVSYASRMADLLLEWDDNWPNWRGTSSLTINGVPVPVIYWPTIYKYWKSNQWKGVKKHWFDWKILVRAMTATTLDQFWARFSVPGKNGQLQRMKYTPIIARLAEERHAENQRLSDLALRELTTEQLTYRRGSNYYVMKRPSMIANTYRRLKGLEVEDVDDDDVED
ncbi:hypothetical protein B0H14DRAFT_2686793 [Mycena olivaceomarginata]|nr:hypothetical protein B0H14DRAFT_2686793 [Mycena olivaceomarginata]